MNHSQVNLDLSFYLMNKLQYLTLSGLAFIATGIVTLIAETVGIEITSVAVSLLLLSSGFFLHASSRTIAQKPVLSLFYKIKSGVCILSGVYLMVTPISCKNLLYDVSLLFLFISLFEILLEFVLLNISLDISWTLIIGKFVVGFLSIMNVLLIFGTSFTDQYSGFLLTGIVVVLTGASVVLFSLRARVWRTDSVKDPSCLSIPYKSVYQR